MSTILPTPPEGYLTAKEVAARLGITTSTACKHLNRGLIPGVRVELAGQPRPAWYASPDDVETFAATDRGPGRKTRND